MCIQWTRVLYSVVLTRQYNPPISQFNSPCNEFNSVWSMFVYNRYSMNTTDIKASSHTVYTWSQWTWLCINTLQTNDVCGSLGHYVHYDTVKFSYQDHSIIRPDRPPNRPPNRPPIFAPKQLISLRFGLDVNTKPAIKTTFSRSRG